MIEIQNNPQTQPQPKPVQTSENSTIPEIESYFMKRIEKVLAKNNNALSMAKKTERTLEEKIQKGQVHVSESSKLITQVLTESHINREEQKRNRLIQKRKQLEDRIRQIDGKIEISPEETTTKPKSRQKSPQPTISEEEHKKFIEKVIKERKENAQKRKEKLYIQEKKRKQEQKKALELEKQIQKEQKEAKKKLVEQKLQSQKQKRQKMVLEQAESNKKLFQLKKKKLIYEMMEQKFQSEVVLPSLQDKKKKLKEIRQFNKAFDIESIKAHQKDYLQKKQKSTSDHASSKEQEWHYKIPNKSERLLRILEEEKINQRSKLEQKKRALEERISRQQNFLRYLKQAIPVKIDQTKRQQIQVLIEKERKKKERPEIDRFLIGNNYLEEAKRAKHANHSAMKKSSTTDKVGIGAQDQKEKKKANTSMNYKSIEQYEEIKRNRLDRLISSSSMDKNEKIKQLKLQVDLLNQKSQRQQEKSKFSHKESDKVESLDTILTSIKAKIGIIDVYNKN